MTSNLGNMSNSVAKLKGKHSAKVEIGKLPT